MRKKLTFTDEASSSNHPKHAQPQNMLLRLGIAKDQATAQKIYLGVIIGGLALLLGLLVFSAPDAENTQPPRNNLPSPVST